MHTDHEYIKNFQIISSDEVYLWLNEMGGILMHLVIYEMKGYCYGVYLLKKMEKSLL